MDLLKTEWLKSVAQGLVLAALVVAAVTVAMVTFAAGVWVALALLQ